MPFELPERTLGFVPACPGFFNRELTARIRQQAIAAIEGLGVDLVVPTAEQTNLGCVENCQHADIAAKMCLQRPRKNLVRRCESYPGET